MTKDEFRQAQRDVTGTGDTGAMLNAAKALAAEVEACHPEWAKGDKPDDAHEPKGAGQAGQKGEGISQTPPSQTPPSQPTQSGDAQNAPVPQPPAK